MVYRLRCDRERLTVGVCSSGRDVIVVDGKVEIWGLRVLLLSWVSVLGVSLGDVFDVTRLLGYAKDVCWRFTVSPLAVISVAKSQQDRCASSSQCQQAGFMNLQVARLDLK
jgi:hypothetical protein